MVHVWAAAGGRGAAAYLVALPDSVEHNGYTAMLPDVFRFTVALHLGVPFGVLRASRTLDCPCTAACRPLDMQGDVLLRCTNASPGPVVRHDMWRTVWSAFLSAHSIVHVDDPQREMRRRGIATPDVVVWLPSSIGRMGIDVTIRHTVDVAFLQLRSL